MQTIANIVSRGSNVVAETTPSTIPGMMGSKGRWVLWLAFSLGLLCALLILGESLWVIRSGLVEIRGVERDFLYTIQRYMQGKPIYGNPNDFPFNATGYAPLYYVAIGRLCMALGIDFRDPEPIIMVARAFSLCCSLLISSITYRCLRSDFGVSARVALFTGIYGFVMVAPWAFVARPDALTILFMLAALASAARGTADSRRKWFWILLSATCSVCAVAAKQSGVQAAACICIFLVAGKRYRDVGVFLAAFIAEGLVAVLLCQSFLGTYLSQNMIGGLADNGSSLIMAFQNSYSPFLESNFLLLALAAISVVSWGKRFRSISPASRLFAIASVETLAFATLTALKVGSGINYYSEFLIVGSIAVTAFLWNGMQSRSPLMDPRSLIVLSALCTIIALPTWTLNNVDSYVHANAKGLRPIIAKRFRTYDAVASFIRARMRNEPPDACVLSFPDGLDNLLPEYCILPQKNHYFVALGHSSYDYSKLRAGLRTGRVRYIVTNGSSLPSTFEGESLALFKPIATIDGYVVYRYGGE